MSSTTAPSRPHHAPTPSTTTAAARPPLTIAPTAIVADKALLTGTHPITVHAHAVVHPFARLDSSAAPIVLGERSAIWEKAVVGGPAPALTHDGADAAPATTIAEHATVGPHASVGARAHVGAHSSVEAGGTVGAGCVVGVHCRLAPATALEVGSAALEDYAVLFFVDGVQQRRVNVSARDFARVRELEAKGKEREHELIARALKGAAAAGKWQSAA